MLAETNLITEQLSFEVAASLLKQVSLGWLLGALGPRGWLGWLEFGPCGLGFFRAF